MINDLVLEGIFIRTWKYADVLLFLLTCYCDPDPPTKLLNNSRSSNIDREEHWGTIYRKKRSGIKF